MEVALQAAVSDPAAVAPLTAADLGAGGLRAVLSAGAATAAGVLVARSAAADLEAADAVPADRLEQVARQAAARLAVPASCARPVFVRPPMDAPQAARVTTTMVAIAFRATRSDFGAGIVWAGQCRPRGITIRPFTRRSICARLCITTADCIRAASTG